MYDYTYVNILNEGNIPLLNEKGPLFGYHIAAGVLEFLYRFPNLQIEETTPYQAEIKKAEYLRKKEEEKRAKEAPMGDIVEPTDSITITVVEKAVDPVLDNSITTDESDDEIDAILNSVEEKKAETEETVVEDLLPDEDNKFKFYSDLELSEMTKRQLGDILRSRGYTSGPYAPKYHDHVSELIAKVKRTQTFN